MEAKAIKRQTAFRLSEKLIDRLKIGTKKENRSSSNYVECILMNSVYEPNETTLEAIREARSGKSAGRLDMKNFDTFMKSVNDIE
ncbi:MAG: toxin-antitoxin system protein [Prevotella sp.]|jgi:predicted DNA-binding protein|nr:toxin-antitoxin system protein [Prevotella sp.]